MSIPKNAINEIIDLVNDSHKDRAPRLEVYNIVNSNDDELIFINFWESIDAFVEYINSHHNMIELIEHLCVRIDKENVSKAYSGPLIYQSN